MNENLRAKLEKLKALADEAQGKPEGIAALSMFQKLLKKYGVDEQDVAQSDESAVECRCIFKGRCAESWIISLASALAPHFRCIASYSRIAGSTHLNYEGFQRDLDIAHAAFNAAHAVILRMSAQISGNGIHNTRKARNSYRIGFVMGLDEAFKRQESSGELGISVIVPDTVALLDEGRSTHKYNCRVDNITSFKNGMRDGNDYLSKRRLQGD